MPSLIQSHSTASGLCVPIAESRSIGSRRLFLSCSCSCLVLVLVLVLVLEIDSRVRERFSHVPWSVILRDEATFDYDYDYDYEHEHEHELEYSLS